MDIGERYLPLTLTELRKLQPDYSKVAPSVVKKMADQQRYARIPLIWRNLKWTDK